MRVFIIDAKTNHHGVQKTRQHCLIILVVILSAVLFRKILIDDKLKLINACDKAVGLQQGLITTTVIIRNSAIPLFFLN